MQRSAKSITVIPLHFIFRPTISRLYLLSRFGTIQRTHRSDERAEVYYRIRGKLLYIYIHIKKGCRLIISTRREGYRLTKAKSIARYVSLLLLLIIIYSFCSREFLFLVSANYERPFSLYREEFAKHGRWCYSLNKESAKRWTVIVRSTKFQTRGGRETLLIIIC